MSPTNNMAQTPQQMMRAQKAATALGITIPTNISSKDLTAVPTTPVVTPEKPTTGASGVMGAVQSSQDQFTKSLEEARKTAEKNKEKSLQDYTTQLFDAPTKSGIQASAYESEGVNSAQKELDDINSQLMVEQRALEIEKQRIEDNAVGASMGQVQNMVNEVERKSLRKQADLAVIQMGLQGKYNTAKAIADRAVDAEVEKEKNKLEALRINYEDNKSLFTTAEQRQYESLLVDRQNKYNEDLASKKAISDYSIEAMKMGADGATITAIRNAKTPDEAQAIASEFMAPIIQQDRNLDIQSKQAQIAREQQGISLDRERLDLEYAKLARDEQDKQIETLTNQGKLDKQTSVQMTRANRIMTQVDDILGRVGYGTTGIAGVLGFIPGTPQKNLRAEINSLKANVGFNELQEMRNSSPTGGALGQVAVQELDFLQSTLGSLDPLQSPANLRQNLEQVKSHFQNWKAVVEAEKTGYITVVSKDGTAGTIPAEEFEQALKEGYTLP